MKEIQAFLDDIVTLDKGRAELKSHYANTFRDQLDAEIAGVDREIEVTHKRLELIRKIAGRHEELIPQGGSSQAATDEAWLRVSELEWQLVQLQRDMDNFRVRRAAANNGVFMTLDGEDPEWVRGSRVELKLQKNRGASGTEAGRGTARGRKGRPGGRGGGPP